VRSLTLRDSYSTEFFEAFARTHLTTEAEEKKVVKGGNEGEGERRDEKQKWDQPAPRLGEKILISLKKPTHTTIAEPSEKN